MPELTAEQKKNIRTALRVAKQKGASPKEQKALVEAMGVESTYRDLNYGDRDSLGILQQRNNGAWGAAKESVATDVGQFLDVAREKNATGKYGSAGKLAQAVQVSAFPDRYNQRSGEADQILATYGGAKTSSQKVRTPTSSQTQAGTPAVPGVDNSGLRRQLVGQFLQQGGVQNSNAVLGLAAQYGQAADVPGVAAVPGAKVKAPKASTSTQASASGHVYPTGPTGKVIGTPYAGTHTLGNWQSDNAVDLAVPVGTPMLALQDGVIVKVTKHPQGSGRFAGDQITVRGKNGNEYFYAHGVAKVKAGQKVKRGQSIGTTGSANGVAHLHFGQERGDPRQHTK